MACSKICAWKTTPPYSRHFSRMRLSPKERQNALSAWMPRILPEFRQVLDGILLAASQP